MGSPNLASRMATRKKRAERLTADEDEGEKRHTQDPARDGEDLVRYGRKAGKKDKGPTPLSVPLGEALEFFLGETGYVLEESGLQGFPTECPDCIAGDSAHDRSDGTNQSELECPL